MNVFRIHKGIRKVGHNYGLPVWFVDCGLGVSYPPEGLLRKLAEMGLQEKSWVVIRNGMSEQGIGAVVDALGFVRCRVEVEAYGRHTTPAWFPKASCWSVYWDGRSTFNFGAMRKGRDMLIAEDLEGMLQALGTNDLIDKGCLVANATLDIDLVHKYGVRVYQKETENGH